MLKMDSVPSGHSQSKEMATKRDLSEYIPEDILDSLGGLNIYRREDTFIFPAQSLVFFPTLPKRMFRPKLFRVPSMVAMFPPMNFLSCSELTCRIISNGAFGILYE